MLALSHPDLALAFPEGTVLHPQVFVHNTMAKPVDVALRFHWRNANASGQSAGPSFRLTAYETRRIDVAALQASSVLPGDASWASVTLTTSGLPEEVVAIVASYDETLRYGAQTPFSDQLSAHWVGSLWEYDAQHNSLITTGNGGTKPLQARFTIYYNQGTQKYELEQTLQPDEQMWIDVGKLIREQVPDKNGNALPPNLTSGSYEIRDLTNKGLGNLFEGKVVYDKTYGHVTYGCGGCCGYGQAKPWFNPLGIPLLASTPTGVDGYTTCTASWDDVSYRFYGNWSTYNTAIATVDYYANHTGHAVGSTTSGTSGTLEHVTFRGNSCNLVLFTPGGNDNVLTPDHLVVISDINGGVAACPTVIGRKMVLEVVNSQDEGIPNTPVQENFVSLSQNTCGNGQPNNSKCAPTDQNGQFPDNITVNCGGLNGPPHCGYNITDHWEWCPAGQAPKNLGTLTEVVHIDAITVNGNTTPNHFQTGYHIYPQ